MAEEPDEQAVAVVSAWLQKGRMIMGRRVMWPVEGGEPVARALATDLLRKLGDHATPTKVSKASRHPQDRAPAFK